MRFLKTNKGTTYMKTKKQEKGLYMTNEGFFLGRKLKNGNLSKDSRRITEEEIMKMFSYFFSAYCVKNNTSTLFMDGGDGYAIAVKEIKTE